MELENRQGWNKTGNHMSSNETQTDPLSLSKRDTRRKKKYYKMYYMSEKKINYLLHAS